MQQFVCVLRVLAGLLWGARQQVIGARRAVFAFIQFSSRPKRALLVVVVLVCRRVGPIGWE